MSKIPIADSNKKHLNCLTDSHVKRKKTFLGRELIMKTSLSLAICFMASFVLLSTVFGPTIIPDFTVEKVCLTSPVPADANALFDIVITNTGLVPLTFEVDDPAAGVNMLVGPVSPGEDLVMTVEVPGDCIDGQVSNTVTVQAFYNSDPVLLPWVETAACPCQIIGDEGCTPGYWKNNPTCWCPEFSPEMLVGDVWAIPASLAELADDTLMQALDYGGGPELVDKARILLRQATAALLNACNDQVSYPLTVEEIINGGNDALASEDHDTIEQLKDLLDVFNNQYPCPISSENSRHACQREEEEEEIDD